MTAREETAVLENASWDSWQWQFRNRISTEEELSRWIHLTREEKEALKAIGGKLRFAITPHFASLMDKEDVHCPIRRQVVPLPEEMEQRHEESWDPCAEEGHKVTPNLIHRYPNRAMLLVTSICAAYCRFCAHRAIPSSSAASLSEEAMEEVLSYLRKNKGIREVLLSGGDPLLLADEKLEPVLKALRTLSHIEIIRIGTRIPSFLPRRITSELCALLRKYHPIWITLSINHPREITPETRRACEMLADSGIPLGCQTVLLRGINDRPEILEELAEKLLAMRVRPYYLYQCDPLVGTEHFRTPVDTGVKILASLQGNLSGLAGFTFVVDAPGGGGKIPLYPDFVVSRGKGRLMLRNFEGKVFEYKEVVRPGKTLDHAVGF